MYSAVMSVPQRFHVQLTDQKKEHSNE
uniref:Uncharacterized protein n=1 Tax=Anguilla anguilla TaxID=7936 RepID=A0A0E9QY18_ANGAN